MKFKKKLPYILAVVFWLAVWQVAAMMVNKEIVLPSVLSTVAALFELMKTADFYISVLTSVLRISAGFAAGVLIGVILASFSYASKTGRALTVPLITVMKATPVASIIIILLVWLSRQTVPTVATMLIVIPIVAQNIYTGLTSVDKQLLEMSKAFNMSRKNRILRLFIPSAMPYFSTSATVGIGMAWKAGVAAEVICNPKFGLGADLYESKIYLETSKTFAITLAVIAVSAAFELLFKTVFKKRRRADVKA